MQKYQSNLEIHGKFNVALFDAGAPGAEWRSLVPKWMMIVLEESRDGTTGTSNIFYRVNMSRTDW